MIRAVGSFMLILSHKYKWRKNAAASSLAVRFVVLIILRSRNQTLFSDINFGGIILLLRSSSVCFLPYKYSCMPREKYNTTRGDGPTVYCGAAPIIPLFRQCQISGAGARFTVEITPWAETTFHQDNLQSKLLPNWLGSNYTNLNRNCCFAINGPIRRHFYFGHSATLEKAIKADQ